MPTTNEDLLRAVLALHRLQTYTQCGAKSMPVVHHHGGETDHRPGPLRTLTCTRDAGHDGLHRDTLCCYRFQTFEDWQVTGRGPRVFDFCAHDNRSWPCDTIKALQDAHRGESDGRDQA